MVSVIELQQGDCLELMKSLEDKSVDLILCDLPYGTTRNKWDSIIDLELLWEQYNRVIKDRGAILLFAQTPFDKVLGVSNLENLRYEIIWQKTAPTGFLNAKKMPMKAHENILVFYKKLPTYNPQITQGHPRKVSSKKSRSESAKRHSEKSLKGESNYGVFANDIEGYDSTERYPLSVQVFAKDQQKENYHPTQKPVALLEWLIKTYSNEGDLVLDNCMGSGSTGVACVNLNRNFIGMELTEQYFEIAKERIEKVVVAKDEQETEEKRGSHSSQED
jgi:DNA (cytosine-5-)-methyltransferase